MEQQNKQPRACVSCGKCQKNCEFLNQYQLDFSKEEQLRELAYHCMLCGKCTEVCPLGIDGKQRILDMRLELVHKRKGKLAGYKVLRGEKVNYKYKNYKHGKKKSVLFLGCNYSSLYPKTTHQLIELMEQQGVGSVFDCCGKPIAELGLEKETKKIIEKLNQRFQENGIEELVVVCPNCYYYLKDKIEIPICTIYEKMKELDMEVKGVSQLDERPIYVPCPDRKDEKILFDMEQLTGKKFQQVEGIQCCGLGGVASGKEPNYPTIMAEKLKNQGGGAYLYCASCAGSFTRNGVEGVTHILNQMIGSEEVPDIKNSMINRMKFKFK